MRGEDDEDNSGDAGEVLDEDGAEMEAEMDEEVEIDDDNEKDEDVELNPSVLVSVSVGPSKKEGLERERVVNEREKDVKEVGMSDETGLSVGLLSPSDVDVPSPAVVGSNIPVILERESVSSRLRSAFSRSLLPACGARGRTSWDIIYRKECVG